jgi:hypothetical protein
MKGHGRGPGAPSFQRSLLEGWGQNRGKLAPPLLQTISLHWRTIEKVEEPQSPTGPRLPRRILTLSAMSPVRKVCTN